MSRLTQPATGSSNWDSPLNANFAFLDVIEHVDPADGADALATAITNVNTRGGGIVYMNDGAWESGAVTIGAMDGSKPTVLIMGPNAVLTITDSITMGSDAQIHMLSRNGTKIIADATFPTSTPLIVQGNGSALIFRTRIVGGTINCDHISGSIGIYAQGWNEQSGVQDCIIQNYDVNGIKVDGNTVNTANFKISDVEVFTSLVASHGIVLSKVQTALIERPTVNSDVASSGAGIYVTGGLGSTNVELRNIHVENHTDGVLQDAGSVIVNGLDVGNSTTNAVHIKSGAGSFVGIGLRNNGNSSGKPVVYNEITTTSISSANPPSPNGWQNFYAWNAQGEFCPGLKVDVSGSRGGNAALANLLTALATMGLITNSSS